MRLKSLGSGGAAGGGFGNPRAVTMQSQQQTQSCWAAVSVSVNL